MTIDFAAGTRTATVVPDIEVVAPSSIDNHQTRVFGSPIDGELMFRALHTKSDILEADNVDTIRPRHPRISVVVPAMNEAKNIGWVLERMPEGIHEVILVDGNSTDDTIAVAENSWPGVRVLQQHARGKGAALATGLAAVTGDIAVMIDADGSMDPVEIYALVGTLLSGADVVKGSRATSGGGSHDLSPLRLLGNWGLTFTANRLYRQRWKELCYGYAAFWSDVLPLLGVPLLAASPAASAAISKRKVKSATYKRPLSYGHGFEIEAVLFCRAARAGLRVAEVFSFEHERRHGESNLSTFKDGWRVLTAVIKECRFDARALTQSERHERAYPRVPELHAALGD